MKAKMLCRLGWHRWSRWRFYLDRVNERQRDCLRCGQWELRHVGPNPSNKYPQLPSDQVIGEVKDENDNNRN